MSPPTVAQARSELSHAIGDYGEACRKQSGSHTVDLVQDAIDALIAAVRAEATAQRRQDYLAHMTVIEQARTALLNTITIATYEHVVATTDALIAAVRAEATDNPTDSCPRCGGALVYDEVDIGVGVQRGDPGCPECYWTPDTGDESLRGEQSDSTAAQKQSDPIASDESLTDGQSNPTAARPQSAGPVDDDHKLPPPQDDPRTIELIAKVKAGEGFDVPQPADPEIARLLSASRALHARKHGQVGQVDAKSGRVLKAPNYPEAERSIADALALRLEAHRLDPDKRDPAWLIDGSLNRGVSSEQLIAFYQAYPAIP